MRFGVAQMILYCLDEYIARNLPLQIIQCEFMQKYDINEHFIQNGMMRGI
jgi:hypothetical protein